MDYSNFDYSSYASSSTSSPLSSLISLAFAILSIVGLWKVFTKAGEQGWKSLIPIYNSYILFKIAGKKFTAYLILSIVCVIAYLVVMFGSVGTMMGAMSAAGGGDSGLMAGMGILTLVASLVMLVTAICILVITAKLCGALSRSFGHGGGFAAGLFFLAPIFYIILGFNQDQYLGPNGEKQ